jgi:hypothetical protein
MGGLVDILGLLNTIHCSHSSSLTPAVCACYIYLLCHVYEGVIVVVLWVLMSWWWNGGWIGVFFVLGE